VGLQIDLERDKCQQLLNDLGLNATYSAIVTKKLFADYVGITKGDDIVIDGKLYGQKDGDIVIVERKSCARPENALCQIFRYLEEYKREFKGKSRNCFNFPNSKFLLIIYYDRKAGVTEFQRLWQQYKKYFYKENVEYKVQFVYRDEEGIPIVLE